MPAKLYQEAEQFIKDQFWSNTHDATSTIRISDIVEKKLIEDNAIKDPDYYGHRLGVVHVSSLYGCVRGLVHQAIGSPKTSVPDSRKLGVFKAGNLFEDYIVDSLGSMVLNRQTEYLYKYKNIIIAGRDDGLLFQDGKYSILEAKSVHSDSFWHREREGTLVAWNNQVQLQTYLWLRRILPFVYEKVVEGKVVETIYSNLDEAEVNKQKGYGLRFEFHQVEKPSLPDLGGVFSYISKDDCRVVGAPVKFNQNIIDQIVAPVIDMVAQGFDAVSMHLGHRDEVKSVSKFADLNDDPGFMEVQNVINNTIASLFPAPSFSVWNEEKKQWQTNWLCKYNDYADHCYGKGWVLVAQDEVRRKNLASKSGNVGSLSSAVDSVLGNK